MITSYILRLRSPVCAITLFKSSWFKSYIDANAHIGGHRHGKYDIMILPYHTYDNIIYSAFTYANLCNCIVQIKLLQEFYRLQLHILTDINMENVILPYQITSYILLLCMLFCAIALFKSSYFKSSNDTAAHMVDINIVYMILPWHSYDDIIYSTFTGLNFAIHYSHHAAVRVLMIQLHTWWT